MVQCPYCDAEFGTVGSVKAHITRKTDDAHKGLSGPEHDDSELMGDNAQVNTDTSPEPAQAQEQTVNTESNTDNPAFDTPESESSSGGGCPRCGGSLQSLPAGKSFTTTDGRQGVTEQGDTFCNSCEVLIATDGSVYE